VVHATKGGAGKSAVAANLAWALEKKRSPWPHLDWAPDPQKPLPLIWAEFHLVRTLGLAGEISSAYAIRLPQDSSAIVSHGENYHLDPRQENYLVLTDASESTGVATTKVVRSLLADLEALISRWLGELSRHLAGKVSEKTSFTVSSLLTLDLSEAQAYAIPAWLELSGEDVTLANYIMRTDGQVHVWQHREQSEPSTNIIRSPGRALWWRPKRLSTRS